MSLLFRKMNKAYIIFLVIAIALFIFIAQGIYFPADKEAASKSIIIEKGQGGKEIARVLEKEGIVKWAPFFRIYLLTMGEQENLKAGEYSLSPSMTISEIVEKMVKGEVLKKKVTIIEGWNLRDLGWHLEEKGIAQAEELFELAGFPATDYSEVKDLPSPKGFDFPFLSEKPDSVGLEGYLFPDTYEILPGEGVEDFVLRVLDNFDKKVYTEIKEEVNSREGTLFEILTMASLIEKEVRGEEDKRIVSGILWKRLDIGMPLQVDATIGYITGKKTTKISKNETEIDSPFNTYRYKGLPLGPICNPGLESIKAALNPKESSYWYYLSTPEGETIFSNTLQEHNRAKARYLK